MTEIQGFLYGGDSTSILPNIVQRASTAVVECLFGSSGGENEVRKGRVRKGRQEGKNIDVGWRQGKG